ncbi:MAG: metallophosphoesterase [Planctomycetota bacterium]|jgi:predicted MPP superfamily phosphohydrolase
MTTSEKTVVFVFIAAVVVIYLLETLLISTVALNKLRGKEAPKVVWRKPALLVHFLAITGVLCFIYAFFVEPYWIQVNIIPLRTEKLTHSSFRLVHISDLHCDTKVRAERKLVRLVNAVEPDIIVLTGDTLMLETPSALPLFKETTKSLRARLGKLAIRGNTDIWHLPKLDLFGDTGFEALDANTVQVQKDGETIYISGLSCEHPAAFRPLLKGVPNDGFSIFLYHYSDLVEDLENLNVDLYLAGHTHGGQIALPFYGALITLSKFGKKYESGMHKVDDTVLYVNRGIGGHAWSMRFFARPEITVFDIGPAEKSAE